MKQTSYFQADPRMRARMLHCKSRYPKACQLSAMLECPAVYLAATRVRTNIWKRLQPLVFLFANIVSQRRYRQLSLLCKS